MSRINGEKSRANLQRRKRTADRLKARTARAAASAGAAKAARPAAASKKKSS